ncbi:MAG: NAD(P)-binding domain-containing protein [Spirochaetaceae bacterium]|nr:NAD(P)-binding domain-containing protein [Spirochaetaceae bacterium]
MPFTVCVTTEYDREVIAPALAQLPAEVRVTFGPEVGRDLTRDEVLAAAADAGAVIASSEAYDGDLFAALPGLRMVTRDGVGYNAVDLMAATEHGVLVTNAPVMHIATANFAMGMITALVRRILVADRETRNRGWTRRALFLAPGMDAMTLGVVGYGNIGRGVAQRALAHGMRVLAFSRGLTADQARRDGVTRAPVDQILATSNVVSLHVPLTDHTRGLVGAAELASMRPGSYLVNTSRGAVVDEAALIDALRSGHLAGAALDVFEEEPVADDNPLLTMENTIVSPHIGSDTTVATHGAVQMCVQNITAYLQGAHPPNLLNPDVLDRVDLPG